MIDFAIDNYLRISWQDVLLVCISSLIIVLVCKKFFWSKLLDWVDRRQKAIQDNIDESVRLKDEAMEVKNKYDEQMRQAGAKADEILSSARAQADLEKRRFWITQRIRRPISNVLPMKTSSAKSLKLLKR